MLSNDLALIFIEWHFEFLIKMKHNKIYEMEKSE